MQRDDSIKDISDKWLESISKSFEKLRFYEQVLRDGCQDLFEYLNAIRTRTPHITLSQAKLKSADMMINEFDILFNDIEVIIEKKLMEEMRKKLIEIGNMFLNEQMSESSYNNSSRPPVLTNIILTNNFFKVRDMLTALRRDLIINSKKLLFVQEKEKKKGVER